MVDVVIPQFVIDIVLIAVSFIALNWASNLAIKNALKVATITELGKTAVGFSLIAFATSLPELTVAIIAAVGGDAAISVGNALGSNIVNICVIIGFATILLHLRKVAGGRSLKQFFMNFGRRSKAEPTIAKTPNGSEGINIIPALAKSELSSIYFGLFIASIVPMILFYITGATWAVGLILLFIFVGYMYQLSKIRIETQEEPVTAEEKLKLKRYLLLTVAGALGVVISAYFLVESAVSIATSFSISQQVIGATIIAFGTSLPEFTIDIKAFLRGHAGLAFGDIIGSSFVNITLILGITLFVPAVFGSAVSMNMEVFRNLIIFSIITNLFFWYFLSREKISWQEGAIFLFIYILFIATTVGLISPSGPSVALPVSPLIIL